MSSLLWNYFVKIGTENKKARCKTCQKVVTRPNHGTSNMRSHLKTTCKGEYKKLLKLEEKKTQQSSEGPSTSSIEPLAKQPKLIQSTVPEAFQLSQKWPADHSKSRRIDALIGEMICLDHMPFQTVCHEGFNRLMNFISPQYQMKSKMYMSQTIIPDLYAKVSVQVRKLLETVEYVSLTTDCWTSRTNESLMSLTAHGVNHDFKRVKIVLCVTPLSERHTANYLAEVYVNMIDQWDLKDKVHLTLRDAGSNILKALDDAGYDSINCTAHQINLVVKKGIDPRTQRAVANILAIGRKITSHFNHSPTAWKALETIQKDRLHIANPLKPIKDIEIRWNSSLHMLSRLDVLKDALSLYRNCPHKLSDYQWNLLPNIISALSPFDEITKALSGSNACISEIIPLIKTLLTILEDSDNPSHSGVKTMYDVMLSNLKRRYDTMEENRNLAMATFLDPRYKHKCLEETVIDSVVQWIVEEAAQVEPQQVTVESQSSSASAREQGILSAVLEKTFFSSGDTVVPSDLEQRIERYKREVILPRHQDPLHYWKQNNEYYPILSQLAKKYLSAPPTSVPSEQLFSQAGLVYNQRRSRLKGKRAEQLLFVKHNNDRRIV